MGVKRRKQQNVLVLCLHSAVFVISSIFLYLRYVMFSVALCVAFHVTLFLLCNLCRWERGGGGGGLL